MVLAVAAGRGLLEAVLIDPKRAERLRPVLALLDPATPVYAALQGVLDAVVGFHIHRGILAIGRRPPEPSAAALLAGLPERCVVLALFGIGNHDNMGGLFRNAAAFGAGAVLLAPDCCDPLYRKAIRVSVGAALRCRSRASRRKRIPSRCSRPPASRPWPSALSGRERLSGLEPPQRAAILLGAEGLGLPPGLLARTRTVRIPMSPGWDSLNVAAAGALALHHVANDLE